MTTTSKHVYDADLGPESDLNTFFKSSMLVTQTGFFRQSSLYKDLEKKILPTLFNQKDQRLRKLRIWSAGCSDGREPYSIGMTILKWLKIHDISCEVEIDASDINEEQIDIGMKGYYVISTNEKEKLKKFRDYYHQVDDKPITIVPFLSRRVNFRVEDIISKSLEEKYDVVVCTNVLLYYDKEYRKIIAKTLAKFLREGGYLFIESIGSRYLKQIGFIRVNSGSHFYQKVSFTQN